MKKYKYRAKRGPGETVEGSIAAATQDEAVDKINEMGLFPIDVNEEQTPQQVKHGKMPVGKRKIRNRDIITFYRQLAKLVKSGVPILRAIQLISEQVHDPGAVDILKRISQSVREGYALSTALTPWGHIFGAFDIAMIQAGENAGKLDIVLDRVVRYRCEQADLMSKVRMALAYPVFMMLVGFGTVTFMLAFVIPRFALFFADLGQELPLPTKLLIGFSEILQRFGFVALVLIAGSVVLGLRMIKNPDVRRKTHQWQLKMPWLGLLLLKVELIRVSRTLSMLLQSGIPILSAMKISIPVVHNEVLKLEFELCHEILEDGQYLSEGFRQSKIIPKFMTQIVSLGEESGKLDEALTEVADWYEQETVEVIATVTRLLEPLVILIVGGILGFLIIALLLPVFSLEAMVAA